MKPPLKPYLEAFVNLVFPPGPDNPDGSLSDGEAWVGWAAVVGLVVLLACLTKPMG